MRRADLQNQSKDQPLEDIFRRFSSKLNGVLSLIARRKKRYLDEARTPFQIFVLFELLAVAVWLLGGGSASWLPVTIGGFALIISLEARASAEGISSVEHEIFRNFSRVGPEVERVGDELQITLADELDLARQSFGLLVSVEANSEPESHCGERTGLSPDSGEHRMSALEATAAFSAALVEGARRFKHHSIYNVGLILVQRPGARAVGTQHQWAALGRCLCADAIPIVILWPVRRQHQ